MRTGSRARGVHRRRRVVAALVAIALVAVGVTEARRHLPGDVRAGSGAAHGAEIKRYSVRSRFVHRTLAQVAAVPRDAGGERRALLVFLHGSGTDGEESNANGAFFAALEKLGARAPSSSSPTAARAPTSTLAPTATGRATSSTR